MPWGWDTRGPVDVAIGGEKGTPAEAATAHAWPAYEAEYLAKRLLTPATAANDNGKYGKPNFNLNDHQERELKAHVYYDKISEDYKQEADECLKAEFIDWLQGKHKDNREKQPYKNGPGKPRRRYVYRDANQYDAIGAEWDNDGPEWQPTWWGDCQLTHLPGVRDYLRKLEIKKDSADLKMNLLAEHGPQDLESAWMYFKHWVKGRPVGPEVCVNDPSEGLPEPGMRSDFGMQMPGSMMTALPPAAKNARETDAYRRSAQADADMGEAALNKAFAPNAFQSEAAKEAQKAARAADREFKSRFVPGDAAYTELQEAARKSAETRRKETNVKIEEDNQAAQAGQAYAEATCSGAASSSAADAEATCSGAASSSAPERSASPVGPRLARSREGAVISRSLKDAEGFRSKDQKDFVEEGAKRRAESKQAAARKGRAEILGKERVKASVTETAREGEGAEQTDQRIGQIYDRERKAQVKFDTKTMRDPMRDEGSVTGRMDIPPGLNERRTRADLGPDAAGAVRGAPLQRSASPYRRPGDDREIRDLEALLQRNFNPGA